MREEPRQKIELQHTIIWYGGSCTNKHDKLMGISIQVLSNTISHATKNEITKNTVNPYLAGTVNHATMNETMKITDTIFIWHVHCIYKRKQIKNYTFGQKMPFKIHYKEGRYMHMIAVCYAA